MRQPTHMQPAEGMREKKSLGLVGIVAIVSAVFILVEGVYLVVTHPALRIMGLVAGSLASVFLLWAATAYFERSKKGIDAFFNTAFPAVFLVVGLAYLFFFPPGTVPDEDYHYYASYSYANIMDPFSDRGEMRVEDVAFMENSLLNTRGFDVDFWRAQGSSFSLFATHEGTVLSGHVNQTDFGANLPQLKIFSALGILIGRALSFSATVVYYLGRLFNFLSCFALIVLAVRLMPVGRNIMATIALLPMTLHLLGSYSYDAPTIALAFLFIALTLRAIVGEGALSRKLLIADLVVSALLAPCKLIYYVMVPLCLLVPTERFASRRHALLWKAAMLLLPLVAVVAVRLPKLVAMTGAGSTVNMAQSKSTDVALYTVRDILARPLSFIMMFLRTLYVRGDFFVVTCLGGSLGWFQAGLEAFEVQNMLLLVLLILAGLSSLDDGTVLPNKVRVASLVTFVVGFFAVILSLMLVWTLITADVIEGVQGRYFLPLLPLLFLGLRGKTISVKANTAPLLFIMLAGFNLLYLAQIGFVVMGGPWAQA